MNDTELKYDIFELDQLIDSDLSYNKHIDFIIATLYWLIPHLHRDFEGKLNYIQMKVIKTYGKFGHPYPALAIITKDGLPMDDYDYVEATCRKILRNQPMIDFIQYIDRSGKVWSEERKRFTE